MKQYPTLVKIVRLIFAYLLKICSFHHYQTNYIKEWVKNDYDGGLFIVENFNSRNKELDQQSVNCVARNKCFLKMCNRDTLIEQSL